MGDVTLWGYGNREFIWILGKMWRSGMRGIWRGARFIRFKVCLRMVSSATNFLSWGARAVWVGIFTCCHSSFSIVSIFTFVEAPCSISISRGSCALCLSLLVLDAEIENLPGSKVEAN